MREPEEFLLIKPKDKITSEIPFPIWSMMVHAQASERDDASVSSAPKGLHYIIVYPVPYMVRIAAARGEITANITPR